MPPKPSTLAVINTALAKLLGGERRVDVEDGDYQIVAYWVQNVLRIDLKPLNAAPHPSSLPDGPLEATVGHCVRCGEPVRWGLTKKGSRAPFGAEPPHANHLARCHA